jgi:hypothetical protein
VQVIGQDQYFPTLATNSYMWSYVVSGGSVYGSDYIGTSDAWALNEPKVVFTSFLGSYFGQWDKESDFLRAPLGTSGYTLTCIFSGQPEWILHTMGMGEPIGEAALLTQNDTPTGLYPPQVNAGAGQVHIALMGDPTLRMHTFRPSGPIGARVDANGVTLSWAPSPDPAVLGYYVYAIKSGSDFYQRISGDNPITTPSFNDPMGNASVRYMVRAVKLEQTPGGSYYNLSQGIFCPDSLSGSGVPVAPRGLAVSSISQGSVNLSWISTADSVRAFSIERRTLPFGTFAEIGEPSATDSSFSDTTLSPGAYAYRVKALGFAGDSDFSGEANVNLLPSSAAVMSSDKTTGGNWIGAYGKEGYLLVAGATNLPSYVTLSTSNAVEFLGIWDSTANPATPLRPDGRSRLDAEWLNEHHTPMTLSFRFNDPFTHRVSIYMVDDLNGVRSGTLDVLDPFTGHVFDSLYFTNFAGGEYITLDLRNYADVRLTPEFEFRYSVFVNGLFFDAADALVAPSISPSSGAFAGKTTVSIAAPVGAKVLYTTDGTDPGSNSLTYNGPFLLTTNATIKAKAVMDGYKDSPVASASLMNTLSTLVLLSGTDTATRGDWPGKYGATGYSIPSWSSVIPADVQFDPSLNQTWTWNTTATEIPALSKNSQDQTRIAAAWYSPDECIFNLSVYSTRLKQIALYFLDWDGGGRVEDLTISDLSGATLLTQRLEDCQSGKYVILNAKGLFQVRLRHIAGPNAVLNGIFFGDAQPVSNDPPRLDPPTLNAASGSYVLRINGQTGQVFTIQASQDLRTWIVVGQATLSGSTFDWNIPLNQSTTSSFFRAVAPP